MATTFEEQLDELLGMAREAGDLEADLTRLQHTADTHPPRTSEGRNARRSLPTARKAAAWANTRLASARANFLARHSKS